MDDLEKRLQVLENRIENILITLAKDEKPFTDEECRVIHATQHSMQWRGTRLLRERIALAEATEKHQTLSYELKIIEEDFPQLKENR